MHEPTPIYDQLLREQAQHTQWPPEDAEDTGPDQPDTSPQQSSPPSPPS